MSATARSATGSARESSVYDGSRFLGDVVPRRAGGFSAKLASGRRLPGSFKSERLAMAAITAAQRDANQPSEGFAR